MLLSKQVDLYCTQCLTVSSNCETWFSTLLKLTGKPAESEVHGLWRGLYKMALKLGYYIRCIYVDFFTALTSF